MEVEALKQVIGLIPKDVTSYLLLVMLIAHFLTIKKRAIRNEKQIQKNKIDIRATYLATDKALNNGFDETRLKIKAELEKDRKDVYNT